MYVLLLRLVNTFTINTDKYYLVCDKVNGVKTLKNLVYYIMLAHKSYITYVAIYIADWLVKLGPLKLY